MNHLTGLHQLDLVTLPAGEVGVGSTAQEVQDCIEYWGRRVVDPTYSLQRFSNWIEKEYPKHYIFINGFSISRFPVTNLEYTRFLHATKWRVPESLLLDEPPNHPVWGVTYEDAIAYSEWLGEFIGAKQLRLPTEAEWEYAARGLSNNTYPFGNDFNSQCCNTIESGLGHTTAVDQYIESASEFGVCDLAGNVEEWTMSVYEPYPGGIYINDDLSEVLGSQYRILRGGSFALGGDLARCARRHGPHPSSIFKYRGFRLVAES